MKCSKMGVPRTQYAIIGGEGGGGGEKPPPITLEKGGLIWREIGVLHIFP